MENSAEEIRSELMKTWEFMQSEEGQKLILEFTNKMSATVNKIADELSPAIKKALVAYTEFRIVAIAKYTEAGLDAITATTLAQKDLELLISNFVGRVVDSLSSTLQSNSFESTMLRIRLSAYVNMHSSGSFGCCMVMGRMSRNVAPFPASLFNRISPPSDRAMRPPSTASP